MSSRKRRPCKRDKPPHVRGGAPARTAGGLAIGPRTVGWQSAAVRHMSRKCTRVMSWLYSS